MNRCMNLYWVVAGISLYSFATTHPAIAQITSDGTLPTNVTRSGNVWEITGGEQAGRNLFHSFSQFSVFDQKTEISGYVNMGFGSFC